MLRHLLVYLQCGYSLHAIHFAECWAGHESHFTKFPSLPASGNPEVEEEREEVKSEAKANYPL